MSYTPLCLFDLHVRRTHAILVANNAKTFSRHVARIDVVRARMVSPVLNLQRPSWVGVLLGYAILLLSVTCLGWFVLSAAILRDPPELWLLMFSAGFFLLSVPPALVFMASPRLLGGPLGRWFRLYTRWLARRAPSAPIPWARYAGLFHLPAGLFVSLWVTSLGLITLYSAQTQSLLSAVALVLCNVGYVVLLLAATTMLSLALDRRIRKEQAAL
jgi:hypothetical protein